VPIRDISDISEEDLEISIRDCGHTRLLGAGLMRDDPPEGKCSECKLQVLDARMNVLDAAGQGASMIIMRGTDYLPSPPPTTTSFVEFFEKLTAGKGWAVMDKRVKRVESAGCIKYSGGAEELPPEMHKWFTSQEEEHKTRTPLSCLPPSQSWTCPGLWMPKRCGLLHANLKQHVEELPVGPWRSLFPGLSTQDRCYLDQVDAQEWFDVSSGLLCAAGAGSPFHFDTICPGIELSASVTPATYDAITPTDAWGMLIGPGRKFVSVVDRKNAAHIHGLCTWAQELLVPATDDQDEYVQRLGARQIPFPFQGVHSVGWPTLGQTLLLEQFYGVPSHFHHIDPGDWYMICRGTPHTVVNEGFTAAIAGDNFYDYTGADEHALKHWARAKE
jgi:hypothetical protein